MKRITAQSGLEMPEYPVASREGILSRRQGRSLTSAEITTISAYLENPTHAGVWQLIFTLPNDAPLCVTILNELDRQLKGKKSVEIAAGRRKMKLRLNKKNRQEWRNMVRQKLSFLNSLFVRLHQSIHQKAETLEGFFAGETDYEPILQLLDIAHLRKILADALDAFGRNIMHPGFNPSVTTSKVFVTKRSFMLLGRVNDDIREFNFLSCEKIGLQEYGEFLKGAGRVTDYKLVPVFSPEEQVFAPYFAFLREAAPSVIKDSHVKQLFNKAFSEYEEENYSNCIGTIGLIAEDYLTQVFETFFRDVCPKGLTLGQLYEHIHTQISRKYAKAERDVKDVATLHKELTKALTDLRKYPRRRKDRETLELLRKVLNVIKGDREVFKKKLEGIKEAPKRISVFPEDVRDNMTDLIRFRNAVSHKTMIPIGSYEALRSVYCLMSLVMWWSKEKAATMWESDPDAIMRASILRNTQATV